MDAFKKTTTDGKNIYCYGIDLSQGMTRIGVCNSSPKQFKRPLESCGIVIEPLHGQDVANAQSDKTPGLPKSELQNNSVCLFFTRPESVDALIATLQQCKEELEFNLSVIAEMEYKKKYHSRVIKFSDIPQYPQEREKSNSRFLDAQ